jgi:uncharacterized protein (DUF433 family)
MEQDRIICDPAIMVGKPTIAGTRITVELVLEHLCIDSVEEFLESYPHITRQEISAALKYAHDLVHAEWQNSALNRLRQLDEDYPSTDFVPSKNFPISSGEV